MKKLIVYISLAVFISGCSLQISSVRVATPGENSTIQRSYFLTDDFFNRAYQSSRAKSFRPKVYAGIIPHHLLASYLIADFFRGLEEFNQPSVVVLIGPNHMGAGRYKLAVSQAYWWTPYGYLPPDEKIIQTLRDEAGAGLAEEIFPAEHAVTAEVAFIKKSFPQTKIVPLIIKDMVTPEESEKLAKILAQILPRDALVLASLDFAHFVSPSVADQKNKTNIEILKSRDQSKISDMFVDSKPTVRVLMSYLSHKGLISPYLLADSNTAEVINDPDLAEVTSYLTVYYY